MSVAARIAFAEGFGSPFNEPYKQQLSTPTGALSAGQSPRVPVGPAAAIQPPSGRIPTSTQKPKRTNVAIPYTRAAPDNKNQIDAGEIVLLNRHSSQNRSAAMNIGKGLGQLCTVATLEYVNALWANEPAIDMGASTRPPGMANLPLYALAWTPDGVSIAWDNEGGLGQPNLVTVCVAGPTSLLNNQSAERKLDRRAFMANGIDGPCSRIYVGLRASRVYVVGLRWKNVGSNCPAGTKEITNPALASELEAGNLVFTVKELAAFKIRTLTEKSCIEDADGNYYIPDGAVASPTWTLQWERFSSGMIYRRQLEMGNADRPLIAAWCMGKLTDNNLNAKFEKSGSLFVAMQLPLTTRFADSAVREFVAGPRTIRSVLKQQTVEQQLLDGQSIAYLP